MFIKNKKLLKEEPKYKTTFEASAVRVYDPSEQDIYEAKASYQNLKAFLPKDIDFERSYDLLGVSFSAFVTSRANKNSQMISGADAKKLAPLFLRRPINKEHNRKETIGVITNYGFSEFGTERPLSEDEVDELIAKEEPFNVNLGGVLWKVCDADYIENLVTVNASDSASRPYACSWEVGFNEFKIAEGSKNLSEANVISDPDEIEAIYESLAHFAGSGINPKTNLPIYILLGGEDDSLQGLGIGITKSPAAEVGKLLTTENVEDEESKLAAASEAGKDKDNKSDETIIAPTKSPIVETAFDAEIPKGSDTITEVTCAGCKHVFDYAIVPEASAGIVNCPNCNSSIDQTGKVYNNESDETKFGPTDSPIVDTAFQAAASEHFINVCSCGETISTCRCPSPTKTKTVVEAGCQKCITAKKVNEKENILGNSKNDGVITLTATDSQEKTNKKKTYMKLTDITDEALTKGEVTASALRDLLSAELEKGGEEYGKKIQAEKDAALASETLAKELADKLSAVQAEIDTLRNDAIAREKAETFNTRLEGLASDYDFDDEEKQIVAERIKDLDAEGFDKYVKELAVFAKAKKKMPFEKAGDKKDDKEPDGDGDDKKDAKAKEVIASLEVDKDQKLPLNPIDMLESTKERWAKGFANGGVTVTKGGK